MYDNHREDFGRRRIRSEDDQRPWQGYGDRSGRDEGWSDRSGYRSRGDYDAYGRDGWRDDDHDRDERHFRATADYQGDNRQTSYYTGAQNSWAVPPARTYSGGYGASYDAGYGRDYREHGFGDRDHDRNERGFFAKAGDEVASWFGSEDAARRREADHRGRGPKDYVRSDDRIRDDVNDRLTDDWRVDASNITVTVDKGEVTLNGTVTARAGKRRAEDVTEDVSGVKHVQNNLRVAETKTGAYDDNWAMNQRSTAEGGTLGKDATTAKH